MTERPTPEHAAPDGAVPERAVPDGAVPGGAVPERAVPERAVPDGAAPDGAAPEYDVLVVGGGPAGLSAAVWAARYRRRVLVVDAGEQRNLVAEAAHGYLGLDGAPPAELLQRAYLDVARYPEISVRRGRVIEAGCSDGGFAVTLEDGTTATTARVVLACGTRDEHPDIEGFTEHFGADVHTCPSCDAYEAQGRDVAVIGHGAHIGAFATGLFDWARSITIVTNGLPFEGDDDQREVLDELGIALVEDDVVGISGGRGSMRGLRLRSGTELACQVAFFSLAVRQRTELAEMLGCRIRPDGAVEVDDCGATSVPGVHAAGDLLAQPHLVLVAAASGAVAGVAAAQSLRGEHGSARSPEPAPDPAVAAPH